MKKEPYAKECAIVMIGAFQPALIHSYWLKNKGFISDAEAEEAIKSKNYVVLPDITQFTLSFGDIQILQNRFSVSSAQEEYFDKLYETVMGIFSLLKETPIQQMGINTTHYYELNEEELKRRENLFTHRDFWSRFMPNPSFRNIKISFPRNDELKGIINVEIENGKCSLSSFRNGSATIDGIKIAVNDHYDLYHVDDVKKGADVTAREAISVLQKCNEKRVAVEKMIDEMINYEK